MIWNIIKKNLAEKINVTMGNRGSKIIYVNNNEGQVYCKRATSRWSTLGLSVPKVKVYSIPHLKIWGQSQPS